MTAGLTFLSFELGVYERYLEILFKIRSTSLGMPLSVQGLADHLSVSARQVVRDLITLKDMGLPVELEDGYARLSGNVGVLPWFAVNPRWVEDLIEGAHILDCYGTIEPLIRKLYALMTFEKQISDGDANMAPVSRLIGICELIFKDEVVPKSLLLHHLSMDERMFKRYAARLETLGADLNYYADEGGYGIANAFYAAALLLGAEEYRLLEEMMDGLEPDFPEIADSIAELHAAIGQANDVAFDHTCYESVWTESIEIQTQISAYTTRNGQPIFERNELSIAA